MTTTQINLTFEDGCAVSFAFSEQPALSLSLAETPTLSFDVGTTTQIDLAFEDGCAVGFAFSEQPALSLSLAETPTLSFDVGTIVLGGIDDYTGAYEADALFSEQVFATKNKRMTDDFSVHAINYTEAPNESGITLTIGG